jgi:hypothetical protein
MTNPPSFLRKQESSDGVRMNAGLDPSVRWDDETSSFLREQESSDGVRINAGLDPSVRWDDGRDTGSQRSLG